MWLVSPPGALAADLLAADLQEQPASGRLESLLGSLGRSCSHACSVLTAQCWLMQRLMQRANMESTRAESTH